MSRSMLLLRKRDVVPGRRQIGLFIRFVDGAKISAETPQPTEAVDLAADWLLHMTACKHGCKFCHDLRLAVAQAAHTLDRRIAEDARKKASDIITKLDRKTP